MKDALSSIRGRTRQKIFFLFFTSLFLISFIAYSTSSIILSPVGGENNSPPSGGISSSISSEEESIDSWDVHPESGRWNTTLDDSLVDRIVDSQFEVLTIQNETSGSSGYEMNRGTTKTDGKFEWRSKADGSGNQTEYFRDVLGDEADFIEGDLEEFTGLLAMSVSNGILQGTAAAAASDDLVAKTGLILNTDIYHTLEFKIKTSESVEYQIKGRTDDGLFPALSSFIDLTEDVWTDVSFDLTSDSDWEGIFTRLFIALRDADSSALEGDEIIQLDFWKVIGNYDFATYIESEIEDTWDWEDSEEYWFNEEDDLADFTEDNDGWQKRFGAGVDRVDGWLRNFRAGVGTLLSINTTGLSIDADIYKWFTFEWHSNKALTKIEIFDSASNLLATDSTGWAADTKFLFSVNLDSDPDWAGTETDIIIETTYPSSTNADVFYNFTFLYDVELGDLEGWSGWERMNVNPNGRLTASPTTTASFDVGVVTAAIDTSVFSILKIRIKDNGESTRFVIKAQIDGGFPEVAPITTLTGSFVEYIFDLSDDSDWTGITDDLEITWLETSGQGNFDGDEYLNIEYILLLGEFNPSDSVIGLMDSQGTPLLNISTRFFGNNTARFEFELLDSTGELSYHFYSDLFTDLNQFIIGKATFDVLRSRLEVTLTAENNTRIDKITFPNEFTVDSGLTPPLFSNEIAPFVFISTHTIDHSWQSLFIDWIKTDYKEREWRQVDGFSDADILESSHNLLHAQDNVAFETITWRINVANLDALSGFITINTTDNDALLFQTILDLSVAVYGVDSDDGEAHLLHFVRIGFELIFEEAFWFTFFDVGFDNYGTISTRETLFNTSGFGTAINPSMDFAITLNRERGQIITKSRAFFGDTVNGVFDFVQSDNVSDLVDEQSQEFIIETNYNIEFSDDIKVTFRLDDFGFTDKDIFSGIAKAVVEPLGNFFQQIFVNLFKFLAGIFRAVGDIIGLAVLTMQGVLQTAINAVAAAILTMQGVLQTAIDAVTTAVTTMQGVLQTAIDAVTTAVTTLQGVLQTAIDAVTTAVTDLITEIQGLADDIATAVWTGIGDALDFITEAVGGIWTVFIAAVSDILDEIVTVALSILSDIVDIVVGIVFFAWDAIGLPDVLALGNDLIVLFGQLIEFLISTLAEVIQLGTDLAWVVLVGWWIWAIPVQWARANFEPISGFGNFIEVFFYDIFPWNILGFHAYIPQGVVFTLWLILLLPADFAIFTAMS